MAVILKAWLWSFLTHRSNSHGAHTQLTINTPLPKSQNRVATARRIERLSGPMPSFSNLRSNDIFGEVLTLRGMGVRKSSWRSEHVSICGKMSDHETKILPINGYFKSFRWGQFCRDSISKTQSIMYHRPYARSEPCQTHLGLDPIWSAPLPPLPALADLSQNRDATAPRVMLHKPGFASREYRLAPNGRRHNLHPQTVCQPSCKEGSRRSQRLRRPWWKKVFMAPVDGIIWLMDKFCFKPSDECLQCVQMTYFVVLILGAIISAVVTILPLL